MIDELEAIKRILWEDWDPIGVNHFAPDDEYDSYAFQIFVMLKKGQGLVEIRDYLESAEVENMGLPNSGRHDDIARRIVQLRGEK